jgi:FixJ family two-component response regulator
MSILYPLADDEMGRVLVGFAALTKRERQVLERVVNAETTAKVARDLRITVRTVELHRQSVFAKLRASNAADLVRRVVQLEARFVSLPEHRHGNAKTFPM